MDICISKSELSKALSYTQRIAESKTTMPILVNVLLSASRNELKISGSDLEITAIARAEADVAQVGSITVNAKNFSDIVRELPDGMVHITVNEAARVKITADSTVVNMIGVSADEYPTLNGIGINVVNKINSAHLLEMISKTIYAVSLDDTRFNLTGVCFKIEKGAKGEKFLKMAATDGHRLSVITRPAGDVDFEGSCIVPRKGLGELRRILETQTDAFVGLTIQDNFLVVDTENVKMSAKLIDGEFPDYSQVLPSTKGVMAVLNSGALSQALKRVSLMVSEKDKKVRFEFSENLLKISSSSPELGDAKEELEITYSGEPICVGYNARYVFDIASSLKEDQNIVIEVHGPIGPGRFYAEGDESYIGIVMPVRLS